MGKFHTAANDKFVKGQLEHKELWREVDFKEQMMHECLDLYNYGDGLQKYGGGFLNWITGAKTKVFVRVLWWWLNHLYEFEQTKEDKEDAVS